MCSSRAGALAHHGAHRSLAKCAGSSQQLPRCTGVPAERGGARQPFQREGLGLPVGHLAGGTETGPVVLLGCLRVVPEFR